VTRPRTILLLVLGAAAAFGATTLVALEGKDVAVLHTRDDTGGARRTRVWVAESDGALWVEAATPERGFYRDLLQRPEIDVEHAGRAQRMIARAEPGDAGHRRIRALLRDKYGWADRWVALLQDTSRSVAVRLDPAPPPTGSGDAGAS
jgi:hypothetical protein